MTVFIEVKKYLAFLITCSKAVELTLKLTSPTLHRNNQDTDTRRAYVFLNRETFPTVTLTSEL